MISQCFKYSTLIPLLFNVWYCQAVADINEQWLHYHVNIDDHARVWKAALKPFFAMAKMDHEQQREVDDFALSLKKVADADVYADGLKEIAKREREARAAYEGTLWVFAITPEEQIERKDKMIIESIHKRLPAALPQAFNDLVRESVCEVMRDFVLDKDERTGLVEQVTQNIVVPAHAQRHANGGRVDLYVDYFATSIHKRAREQLAIYKPHLSEALAAQVLER